MKACHFSHAETKAVLTHTEIPCAQGCMEIKCTKLRDNKNPGLLCCNPPLPPAGPAFLIHREKSKQGLSSDCNIMATTRHVGESSKRPDLNKKEQMRRLWQQQGRFPCYVPHRQWWRLLSVQTFLFLNWKKFTLLCPMPIFLFLIWTRVFLLQQEGFILFAPIASFSMKQFSKEENEGTVTEDPWKVSETDVGAGGPENRAIHFIGFI